MCEELHDPFEDQVACARFKAERDALAQRMEEVASEIDRTLSGVEGIEDAPAMRWMRGLREALGSLHAPRISYEDIEAARWVRENGGVDECERKAIASIEVGERYTSLLVDLAKALGCGYEEIYDNGGVLDDEDAGEHLVEAIKVKCYLADETARTVTGRAHGKSTPNDILAELRKRLMPEGMEWPRYEDCEPVELGGEFENAKGNTSTLRTVVIKDCRDALGGAVFWKLGKGACAVTLENGERVKRPAPKIIGADGNRIETGMDVWWICEGDERGIHAEKLHVDGIDGDGMVECHPYNGGTSVVLDPTELYVKKPVIDAYGVPIRGRDTVWHIETGREYVVVEPSYGETVVVRLAKYDDAEGEKYTPDQLTHTKPEPPDSWERIEEDKGLNPFDYCKQVGRKLWTFDNADEFKASDLVRRCKALAERGRYDDR